MSVLLGKYFDGRQGKKKDVVRIHWVCFDRNNPCIGR